MYSLLNKYMQVNDLSEASKTYETLGHVLDHDVLNGTVKKQGSLSRHLRRVRLGLDLIKVLFEQFLSSRYVHSLASCAITSADPVIIILVT